MKPRFGVVVHRTLTENFDLENANSDAIKEIMEENDLAGQGYQIEEVAWLKRKDKMQGKFASLGIWLDSAGSQIHPQQWSFGRPTVHRQRGTPRNQEEMLSVLLCYEAGADQEPS